MNKNEIRKEIAELIDSIKQHSDDIGKQKRIPQIELELILSKIKKLYERSIVFNYLNTFDEEQQESKVTAPSPEPYIAPSEPATAPDLEDVVEVYSIPAPSTHHPVHNPHPSQKDIRKLIGLNEKFQFTKELFNNDPQLYSSSLERINASKDKAELHETLQTLSKERGWQPDNKTVESFMRIAERIF